MGWVSTPLFLPGFASNLTLKQWLLFDRDPNMSGVVFHNVKPLVHGLLPVLLFIDEESIMPNVMIRRDESGKLTLYVAKKDLEDTIVSIEKDGSDGSEGWGGTIELADGTAYYVDPLEAEPRLPITLRARRAGG